MFASGYWSRVQRRERRALVDCCAVYRGARAGCGGYRFSLSIEGVWCHAPS
ncbi:hypothetical protein P0E83_13500 [Enterococcus faecalis]|nr:hypothetical protein [Enterococcus faecalis]